MPAPLRFYFDFISPYAYLGWTRIHALAARHDRTVEPVPILFAALLGAHGTKGPAEIAPKRVYTFKHVVRLAHDLGEPLQPPPSHPFNPLLALRIAARPRASDEQRRVIEALYRATWAGGPGVESPEAVATVLDAIGIDGAAEIDAAGEPEAKARVRAATDAAISAGVFGVPTIDADGELFWGQDAYPHLERFLDGGDPVDADWLERWGGLPATATRPGS